MASMTDAIYGVDVFGQRDAVAISFTPPEADVLARLYQLVSDFRPAPKPHTIKIKIEEVTTDFVVAFPTP